jgi:hypothetical protein
MCIRSPIYPTLLADVVFNLPFMQLELNVASVNNKSGIATCDYPLAPSCKISDDAFGSYIATLVELVVCAASFLSLLVGTMKMLHTSLVLRRPMKLSISDQLFCGMVIASTLTACAVVSSLETSLETSQQLAFDSGCLYVSSIILSVFLCKYLSVAVATGFPSSMLSLARSEK